MGGVKDELRTNAIGNLYRTALFLAQGKTSLAKSFLEKSATILRKEELGSLTKLLDRFDQEATSGNQEKYWAEVALDQYKKLMRTRNLKSHKINGAESG
ncbi:hypothetical protein KBI33_01855 [Candidatus Shapirobacteria bacterium]|nr:hypothetical protein [Candidatus Shapirobacteria bacterium]